MTDYKDFARRALLRLAPLTADERAQIARYQPNAGGIIIILDNPAISPLLERAYPNAIKIYVNGVTGDDN